MRRSIKEFLRSRSYRPRVIIIQIGWLLTLPQPGAAKTVDGAGKTPAMTSGKQEGLDNANTSSPFTTDPGKSVKGEQDVETAKLKGTVDPERPQV